MERKSARFKKSPRYSSIPFRSIDHKSDAPIVASVELMNKSCLSSACASEQLGISSSDRFSSSSLNSSVTKGRFSTGLNFSEVPCFTAPIVESSTCPVCFPFPKSIQYQAPSLEWVELSRFFKVSAMAILALAESTHEMIMLACLCSLLASPNNSKRSLTAFQSVPKNRLMRPIRATALFRPSSPW